MNSPKHKRIVSQAEYRRYLAKRFGLTLIAGVFGLAILHNLYAMWKIVRGFFDFPGSNSGFLFLLFLGLTGLFLHFVLGVILFLFRATTRRAIRKLEPVEPVSRHNIDRLPPAQALVRGSETPQTSEPVLLRAAQEMEMPAEQLLRATE